MKTKYNSFQICLLCVLLLPALTGRSQLAVTKITAGYAHSLFVVSDGSLWGMGDNNDGQLGNFTTNNVNAPEDIVGGPIYIGSTPPNVTAIAARDYHSFFIESDGSLWAMGDNSAGEFGNGIFNNSDIPVEILSSQVLAVAVGSAHTLFIKRHGNLSHPVTELWGMGYNAYGQLGTNGTASTNQPVLIQSYTFPGLIGTAPVTAIAAGEFHSLFLKADGSLWTMGYNSDGELGDGTTTDSHVPKQITNGVTTIAAAFLHSFFIKSDGSLWAMGENDFGELGNGTNTDIPTPAMIVSSNVTAIAAGNNCTFFIKSDGSLWGMGNDNNGGLDGVGKNDVLTPELIVAGGVTAAAAGDEHSLFLTSDGSLWGMGDDTFGELGIYNSAFSPVQIVGPLVANGGFETGDFLGWFDGNWILGTNFVSNDPRYVHSGAYGVKIPSAGHTGDGFSQTLRTIPGANYRLSFWLNCDGLLPNIFMLAWNGTNLMDQPNSPNFAWTNLQFMVTATATNTSLEFGFSDASGHFGLDDVSVVQLTQPVITGISLAGTNLVLNVANGLAGKTYWTLMSTNLAQPLSQWTPVATNVLSATGNLTLTATNAMASNAQQRFYILEIPQFVILQ